MSMFHVFRTPLNLNLKLKQFKKYIKTLNFVINTVCTMHRAHATHWLHCKEAMMKNYRALKFISFTSIFQIKFIIYFDPFGLKGGIVI